MNYASGEILFVTDSVDWVVEVDYCCENYIYGTIIDPSSSSDHEKCCVDKRHPKISASQCTTELMGI